MARKRSLRIRRRLGDLLRLRKSTKRQILLRRDGCYLEGFAGGEERIALGLGDAARSLERHGHEGAVLDRTREANGCRVATALEEARSSRLSVVDDPRL